MQVGGTCEPQNLLVKTCWLKPAGQDLLVKTRWSRLAGQDLPVNG
jgi:hypothetical protein